MTFKSLTAGMHASVFAELAKKPRPWLMLMLIRAIEIENAVNKAVMKMEHDALGGFEAKRSHSWLSEM